SRRSIFSKVFDRLDKAVVHGTTFGKNTLAMAAGLASLAVIQEENLIEKATENGRLLKQEFDAFVGKYEFVKEVRGLGMMIGIEFGPPKSFSLKTAWKLLEKANKGLFCQMITIPLFKKHRILSQVAGHASYTIKLLPPLNISREDIRWIVSAFDDVIARAHQFPGGVWDLAANLAGHALQTKKEAAAPVL
ncbi:MAG: aminotransferase class III-fold pyridoxal phosphate-dependent enzyme, partial [Deltaproteobacteria bacterium]|nr:aminotransferase class III-fold pyridoxal phosphate-dependent enzyme [Deltaproteobacteria bacterium]